MPTPSPQNPGLFNWLLIGALGIIWGAAFVATAEALEGFGPWTVAAFRTSVAALTLGALGAAMGQGMRRIPAEAGKRGMIFACGIGLTVFAVPFTLLSWGIQHVPSAFAGVAMGLLPLLILPLVAIFSPEEGIGPRRIAGVTIGFVGLLILIGPDALQPSASDLGLWGRVACILAACCYAVSSVATRRAPKMPPIAFASVSLVTASIILVPLAILIEGAPQEWPLKPTLAALYVAILPTALATLIRIRVITTAGSLFMTMTNYIVPIVAVILGMLLRDEELKPTLFIALALILSGIAISQSRAIQQAFQKRG